MEINFTLTPNPLFDTIFRLYKRLEGSKLSPQVLDENQEDLLQVSSFFNCSLQQAAVLAIMLRLNAVSGEPSIRQVLQYLQLKPSFAVSLHAVLDVFVNRNWMKPKKDIRIFPLGSYQIRNRLVMSFNCMDPEKIQEKPVLNSIELAAGLQQIVADRFARIISFEGYVEQTDKYLHKYADIPLSALIIGKKMNKTEASYFSFFCAKCLKEEEDVELQDLIREINPPREQQYFLKRAFKSRTGPLFEQNLVRMSDSVNFIGQAQFAITDDVRRLFDPLSGGGDNNPCRFRNDFMILREARSIKPCTMIYNPAEDEQVNNLHRLMEHSNFEKFGRETQKEGLPGGLTVLLYGDSGTGKTETALQLSQRSGRPMLQVDASAIKSKWVGETEKNLSIVFSDYARFRKQVGICPILLFNEADAILTRRMAVKERGDHYENAIQNLLLQQLEVFDGIFIGTTNLSENLDNAFQRRILFKLHFRKPVEEVRIGLFQKAFPGLRPEEIKALASSYVMTGSEIMNVKKKLVIGRVLNKGLSHYELIEGLCMEELSMQRNLLNNPIGFKRA